MQVVEDEGITYIKNVVGDIINEGLLEIYLQQPSSPIDFLAKYLLNYSKIEEEKKLIIQRLKESEQLKKTESLKELNQSNRSERRKEKESQERQEEIKKKIENNEYLEDVLEDVCQYLKQDYDLTGVYISQVCSWQRDKIDYQNIDENSHIDLEKGKVLKFIASDQQHAYMKYQTIDYENVGVTGLLFKDQDAQEPNPQENIQEEQFNQEQQESLQKTSIQESIDRGERLKKVYVEEVSLNEKMHFFKYPKLGAYLAVLLEFNKCLLSSEIMNAVEQRLIYKENYEQKSKEVQEKLKELFEQMREKDENGENIDELQQEVDRTKEEINQIQEEGFKSENYQLVISMDSMGKDKEIKEDEIKKIKELCQFIIRTQNEKEQKKFSIEIDNQIEYNNYIKNQGGVGQVDEMVTQQLDQVVQDKDFYLEQFKDYPRKQEYEKQCVINEKVKDLLINNSVLIYAFQNLKQKSIIRFQNQLRFVLFVLGYNMSIVCKQDEGFVLDWRRVKNEIIETKQLNKKIEKYTHRGSRIDKVDSYQTVQSLLQQGEGVQLDEVLNYNVYLWLLLKFAINSVQLRKEDILIRREIYENKKQEIESKEEQNRIINEVFNEKLQEAINLHNQQQQEEDDLLQQQLQEQFEQQQQLLQQQKEEKDKEDEEGQEQQKEEVIQEIQEVPKLNREREPFNRAEFEANYYHENPLFVIEPLGQMDIDLDWQENIQEEQS